MSPKKNVRQQKPFQATFNSQKRQAVNFLEKRAPHMNTLAQRIWETPELGLEEYQSSAALVEDLEGAGFKVKTGVAGMPTSFVARWGKGRPHIGIIAEYDAVPNAGPKGPDNGHGCGHNLFGTAGSSAGIAVKEVLDRIGAPGTIIVFGTPAEEILLGKVKMVKAGTFDDLDAVLSWHPWEATLADYTSCMALDSVIFEFFGQGAHAQIDPEVADNALGGLELMNEGVNRLRGHVPQRTGFHYVIPDGGKYPGVILPYAKSWYWIWSPSRSQTQEATAKVKEIARGAAKATGTRVKITLFTGTYPSLPNIALANVIEQNLNLIGPPRFSSQDKTLARKLGFKEPLKESLDPPFQGVAPYANDQSNVSWMAPLGMFLVACRAPKTPQHHWLSTAQYGSGIGEKGMMVAAKVLACSALDLMTRPSVLRKIQQEFKEKTKGFEYRSSI